MQFRPDIEGLRAIAVVPVVLFHAYPFSVPGGFVGVDIFFVISGYLITGLLLRRLEVGEYSILAFYGARIRRIFPALFCMLLASSALAVWLLPPHQLDEFGRTLAATALFVSNIELYRLSDYFAGAAEYKPLLHTWSLAVEEQFYILFPPLLALLFTRARRWLLPALAAAALLSLLGSQWMLWRDRSFGFYFTGTRAFELLAGALLAVHLDRAAPRDGRAARVAGGLGLACIAASMAFFSERMPFPGFAALLPCVGAVLVIWSGAAAGARSWSTRCLDWAPLRWIGRISYSLYLWHWPVIVFSRHWTLGEPDHLRMAAVVAIAVLASWASYSFVERPFRHVRERDPRLAFGGFTAMAGALGAAAVMLLTAGLADRFDAESKRLFAAANDISPERNRCHTPGYRLRPYAERCVLGAPGVQPELVVWGDSHAVELGTALSEEFARSGRALAQITMSSCLPAVAYDRPGRPTCQKQNTATLKALQADRDVTTVVIAARYSTHLAIDADTVGRGLRQSVETLVAAGKQVWLVESFPNYEYPVPEALGMMHYRGTAPEELGQPLAAYRQHHAQDLQLLQSLSALPGVHVFRTSDVFCPDGWCSAFSHRQVLYFDEHHPSMAGARLVAANLAAALRRSACPACAFSVAARRE